MKREELIRNLEYTMKQHKNDRVDTFGTNIALMCKDVLDYLKEQEPCEDEIILTKEEYKQLLSSEFDNGYAKGYREATQRWIPVSERLPEESADVICCTDAKEVFMASYLGKLDDGTECFDDNNGMMCEGDIVAWMPLPTSYSKEIEKTNGDMTSEMER